MSTTDKGYESMTWTEVIQPKKKWLDLNLLELLEYRDLVLLFVRRDFVATYKQTLLGPLWHFVQPIFTAIIFSFIFGRVAGISTEGMPPFLFYLCGITIWSYFARCLNATSNTFVQNAGIFGKVYFPRMVIPVSAVLSALIGLGIQLLLLLGVWCYYFAMGKVQLSPSLAAMPVLIAISGLLGLGLGTILSSLTTRYRDLTFLLSFGLQLWMYATPVIYPLSVFPEDLQRWMLLNPVAPIVEGFRFILLGTGQLSWALIGLSALEAVVIFILGLSIFHRVEKTFMDTV